MGLIETKCIFPVSNPQYWISHSKLERNVFRGEDLIADDVVIEVKFHTLLRQ